ncbi:hypothetical protein V6N13_046702 [Hibiscus sabdariffa]|uniref:RING-type E3 ubiquitin transferase n=1 Tax=Hibiscus sabdariffa TaxID=183260 RepID=A0ABR2NZP2_9ROSI
MASPYFINIRQEDASFLDQLGSMVPHRLIHIDIEIRRVSSLNLETTLETFNRSFAVRRDMFLFEENVRGIIRSLLASPVVSREFVDTVLVPRVLSHARHAHSLPVNLGRQVIKLRVEIFFEVNLDDEFPELIDESLTSLVNFKPASKSSIEALEKVNWDGEDDRKRKLDDDSSSVKGCIVCLDEFSDGDEVTLMLCGHVYHYNCIVEWLETSHLCPLCRYQMPID